MYTYVRMRVDIRAILAIGPTSRRAGSDTAQAQNPPWGLPIGSSPRGKPSSCRLSLVALAVAFSMRPSLPNSLLIRL